jgi:hypothetical protein
MICSEECVFLSTDPSSKSRGHEINVHLLKRDRDRDREKDGSAAAQREEFSDLPSHCSKIGNPPMQF